MEHRRRGPRLTVLLEVGSSSTDRPAACVSPDAGIGQKCLNVQLVCLTVRSLGPEGPG